MANQLGWALVGMPANFVPIMYYEIAFLSERQQLKITSQYFLRRAGIKCQGFFRLDPTKFCTLHRTKSHVSVFLKRGGNMQLHVSVMFNMHKKWSGSVVYAATETRENVTKPVTETQVIRRVSRTV